MLKRTLGRNEIAVWPAAQRGNTPAHHVKHLTELQLVAVCSPSLPRLDGPLDLDTVLTLPLLQDAHRRWESLLERVGQTAPHSLLNFDRSALALDVAVKDHGVAIAPCYMAQDDLCAGRLVKLWDDPVASGEHLCVSWAKQHASGRALMRLMDEFAADTACASDRSLLGIAQLQ